MNEKENKPVSIFTMSNLVVALISFVAFLVGGIALYYMTVGQFVDAKLFMLYLFLAAVGAVAMFFHWYWFAFFYYGGCVLGWFSGKFVGELKGSFAPTAGLIVLVALIVVFSVLGLMFQWKSFQKRWAKLREEREAARAAAKAAAEAQKPQEPLPPPEEPALPVQEEGEDLSQEDEEDVPEGGLFNAMMDKLKE